VVIVADLNKARLAHARTIGFETIDLSVDAKITDHLEQILGVPEVDCAVDCVGFEAKGHGGKDEPAVVLNQLMEATRAAGAIGIPDLCDGRSRRQGRCGEARELDHATRTRMGQIPFIHDGSDAGDEVQPRLMMANPSRSHQDCQGGECRAHFTRAGAGRVPVVRRGHSKKFVIDRIIASCTEDHSGQDENYASEGANRSFEVLP